ncbi:MAG: cytidylate kinase family protein [Candidatus Nanohaloarchaea archaeon]|nr:cytidylate kinase family protein [Candidatus Nanohaloarchaea archaeon]
MTGIPRFAEYEEELRAEHGAPGDRVVTVSGLTGVGTGTLSAFLADELDLAHVDAGQFFREKAEEHGMTIEEFDSAAERIEAEQGIDFDEQWDRTALRYAYTRDDILLEGRLTGALLQDVAPVRVWVECDVATVAERIRDRDDPAETLAGEDAESLEEYVRTRNRKQLARYREKYGVDPTDPSFYNVVIDNGRDLETVQQELLERVQELL